MARTSGRKTSTTSAPLECPQRACGLVKNLYKLLQNTQKSTEDGEGTIGPYLPLYQTDSKSFEMDKNHRVET